MDLLARWDFILFSTYFIQKEVVRVGIDTDIFLERHNDSVIHTQYKSLAVKLNLYLGYCVKMALEKLFNVHDKKLKEH